jgi:hypothetical protein
MSFVMLLMTLLATAATLGGPAVQDDEDLGWPREFRHAGNLIVMYQPQLETFEGDRLTGRSALSVVPEGQSEPVFGAAWFDAFVETDRENRTVSVISVRVPRVRFPTASEEQAAELGAILELEIATWDIVVSLDRILTGLELAERERAASDNLRTDPPAIIFATEPSILVLLDGEPVQHDVPDTDLSRVVNTPFTIIHDPGTGAYYLYAGEDAWFSAADVMGPWALSQRTPDEVASLIPPDTTTAEPEAEGEEEEEEEEEEIQVDIEDVRIVVATEPTELIVTNGSPEYASIDGTDLLYIENSDSDVFMNITSQQYFIVLAGRWYTAGSLEGAWTFVASDSLPADFAMISPESARGSVLTYIAGTDQAMDAVLDNSIPQTSAIARDGTLEVTYDGEPQFEPIDGTEMTFAVNTEFQVLEIGDVYYVCYEAVWYESDGPTGPFTVTLEVPEEVQKLPADNPNYNVKYVYIYDYTPEVVYTGYTPGYTSSYVYGSTVVYGTGWYYSPWISPYYYYPRPVTYGFRISYNPWYGWGIGFGFSYGPFHFGFRSGPSYWYRRGWWGPGGYRYGYHRGYHRGYGAGYRSGYRAGYRAGQRNSNVYNRQRNAARNVDRATARSQMSQRAGAGAGTGAGQRPATGAQAGQRGQVSQGRQNNLYTDRDGNVHRQNQDGSWQSRDQSGWSQADRSQVEGRAGGADRSRDATRQQPSTRSTTQDRSGNLNRESQNRQRGTQRTQSYQQNRSTSRSGGARRSGGGRRR